MADVYNLKANVPGKKSDAENITGLPQSMFEKYSKGPTAQLMPADPQKGYATPYYAAYTNDGDIAGAVMVAEGQKVRLVDKMTGDVVFEGVGPEGARLATSVANGISQDMGRKAAWAIQKPTDEGGWVSMAEERYDPKKQSALGKLADFALPILGAILMPVTGGMSAVLAAGLGSAAGSALSSVAQGRPLDETLKRAAIAGVTAGVGAKVTPMIGNALSKGAQTVGTGTSAAGSAAAQTGASAVGSSAGTIGAAAPAAVLSGGGNTVAELVVTAAAKGLSIPQIALATGIPAAAVTGILNGSSGQSVLRGDSGTDTLSSPEEPTVDELVVEAAKRDNSVLGGALGAGAGDVITGSEGSDTLGDETVDSDDLKKKGLLDWIKANPELAARLGITAAGLLGGAAGGGSSGGGSGIPANFANAGTPGSLSDRFRANLPAPSGPFANLGARDVSMTADQWKTYGQRPEQSFFANVPIRPSGITPVKPPGGMVVDRFNPSEGGPGLGVNLPPTTRPLGAQGAAPAQPVQGFNPVAPSSVSSTTAADMNRSRMTPEQFAVAMKRMQDASRVQGFKTGGFAVSGPGTGRSDDIPARLSDGEYVIDAETVALLGDGSSQAGSKRLDEFRANIRKHKGKQLAKGEFSHDARKPEAYLHGGRV